MSQAVQLSQLELLARKTKAEAEKAASGVTIPEYSVTKLATAESGFFSSYQLTKDGSAVGEKINIPKDFLVKSASIQTATTADTPYTGAKSGDKYIDFVVNSKDGGDTETHIYLPVNDLVDVYTGGNGIDLSGANAFSVKLDSANANGLSVGANGIALAAATTTAAGAMSAADKTKLDGIEFATDAEVNAMLTEVFGE